jgi:extradiol dioxygenase family protein
MAPPLFHLSIPAFDLAATERWYVAGLGCEPGRRSGQALILDLGGHQLVAQKVSAATAGPSQPGIYPRHFGLVFPTLAEWEGWLERARGAGLRFGVEPKCRFRGERLEHRTFFLIDPAGNWLEFKVYTDPEAVLGCRDQAVVGDAAFR